MYWPATKEGGQVGYQSIGLAFLHNYRSFLDTLKGYSRALNLTKNLLQHLAPKKVKKSFLKWSEVPKTQKCVVSFLEEYFT